MKFAIFNLVLMLLMNLYLPEKVSTSTVLYAAGFFNVLGYIEGIIEGKQMKRKNS